MQKALKRKTRLQALTRRAGRAAQKIYWCGLHPAAMYGDEASGVSHVEWRNLQRQASAAHSPLTAGRPLCALAMVRGPDGVLARCAPLEMEQRSLARSHAPARRNCSDRSDGVKGPVGATFLSLDRLKWTWPSPFQFFDDNNTEIMLTTTSPALLKSMLNAACAQNKPETGSRIEVARSVADSKRGRLSRKESSSLRIAAVNANLDEVPV